MAEQNEKVREALALFTSQLSQRAREAGASLAPWAGERAHARRTPPPRGGPADFYDAVAHYEAVMAKQRARFKPPPPPDPATVPVPVDPHLRQLLVSAHTWLDESRTLSDRWSGLKNFDGWASFGAKATDECGYLLSQAVEPGATYSPAYLRAKVEDIRKALNAISASLQAFPIPSSLVDVPDVVHPPRFAQLSQGILARLIAEDLEAHIRAGREMERVSASLGSMSPSIQHWTVEAGRILRGLSPEVLQGFTRLASGSTACTCPGVASPARLAHAYLVLGLGYLEEVRERMPDYAEASGQRPSEPRISMSFKDGTFYGGQFAANIANTDSTITGGINQGSSDTAAALAALKQALLSDDSLSCEKRRDLIDHAKYLEEAAAEPPEKRNRGILKLALGVLTGAATAGSELGKVLNSWGEVLHKLVP